MKRCLLFEVISKGAEVRVSVNVFSLVFTRKLRMSLDSLALYVSGYSLKSPNKSR